MFERIKKGAIIAIITPLVAVLVLFFLQTNNTRIIGFGYEDIGHFAVQTDENAGYSGLDLTYAGVHLEIEFAERSFAERLLESLFFGALVCFLIGLTTMVRNGGFFKTLGFFGYQRKKRKIKQGIARGEIDASEKLPTFADHIVEKYQEKWDGLPFFISTAGLMVIYAFIFYIF